MGFGYGSTRDNLDNSIFSGSNQVLIETDKKKIGKIAYSSTELCHVWASGNKILGRSGSMFFEYGTIYSYGRHFPAAHIYTNKDGEKLVLINSVRYSPSTGQHLNKIEKTVNHLTVFSVPSVIVGGRDDKFHKENLEHFLGQIEETLNRTFKLLRYYRPLQSIEIYVKNHNDYIDFFGLKVPKITLDASFIETILEFEIKITEKYRAREEKKRLALLTVENELKELLKTELEIKKAQWPEALKAWRENKISNNELQNAQKVSGQKKGPRGKNIYRTFYIFENESQLALLRVNKKEVETSHGASVPLDHAIRLLKLILEKKARKGERVGHYALESVSDQSKQPVIIAIGCHRIDLREALEILGPYLGRDKLQLVTEKI